MSAFAFAAIAPAQSSQLASFEATLAAHASATEALRSWCEARGIASPAQIMARPVSGAPAKQPKGLRRLLGLGLREAIGYRHVELTCGDHVLSSAHNWFVPGRLTPEMNAALASTQVPFGRIAAPLAYTREPLKILSRPPRGCPANTISAHRALLRLPDGRPLAYVLECYTSENLR
jgi:hypothetical protein